MIPKQLSCREFYLNFKRSFELLGRRTPSTFVFEFYFDLEEFEKRELSKIRLIHFIFWRLFCGPLELSIECLSNLAEDLFLNRTTILHHIIKKTTVTPCCDREKKHFW